MEINYCRRCGATLEFVENDVRICKNKHTIYLASSPASGLWIINDKNEILMATRANEPGRGKYDSPGGFNNYNERYEDGVTRELHEELGLSPENYTEPKYLISGIDSYAYEGEQVSVMTVMFYAKIIGNPSINAKDDVSEAQFIPISKVDPDNIYFDTPRASFLVLKKLLGIV